MKLGSEQRSDMCKDCKNEKISVFGGFLFQEDSGVANQLR